MALMVVQDTGTSRHSMFSPSPTFTTSENSPISNSLAPFSVAITPIAMDKNPQVKQAAEQLYQDLLAAGIDVLLDDRGERPGVMFADMELIGVPQRIVIGDRGLQQNMVEYQARTDSESTNMPLAEVVDFIKHRA